MKNKRKKNLDQPYWTSKYVKPRYEIEIIKK